MDLQVFDTIPKPSNLASACSPIVFLITPSFVELPTIP